MSSKSNRVNHSSIFVSSEIFDMDKESKEQRRREKSDKKQRNQGRSPAMPRPLKTTLASSGNSSKTPRKGPVVGIEDGANIAGPNSEKFVIKTGLYAIDDPTTMDDITEIRNSTITVEQLEAALEDSQGVQDPEAYLGGFDSSYKEPISHPILQRKAKEINLVEDETPIEDEEMSKNSPSSQTISTDGSVPLQSASVVKTEEEIFASAQDQNAFEIKVTRPQKSVMHIANPSQFGENENKLYDVLACMNTILQGNTSCKFEYERDIHGDGLSVKLVPFAPTLHTRTNKWVNVAQTLGLGERESSESDTPVTGDISDDGQSESTDFMEVPVVKPITIRVPWKDSNEYVDYVFDTMESHVLIEKLKDDSEKIEILLDSINRFQYCFMFMDLAKSKILKD